MNGKENGKGKFTFQNGDIYNEDFKDGVFSGQGKMIYSNGEIYEGEFKDGKKHGKGIMTFKNKTTFDGEWLNDREKRQFPGPMLNQYQIYIIAVILVIAVMISIYFLNLGEFYEFFTLSVLPLLVRNQDRRDLA